MNKPESSNGTENLPLEYEGKGYTLLVEPGAVTLAMRHRTSKLTLNDGVRAYDPKALRKFDRASGVHSALASQVLQRERGELRTDELQLKDDLYLAESTSAVDRWLANVQRILGRATVAVMLFQSLGSRYDDLVAFWEEGNAAFLAANKELEAMSVELEGLRSATPTNADAKTTPLLTNALGGLTRARETYASAATVLTSLADVRRRTKELYYPSRNGTTVEK